MAALLLTRSGWMVESAIPLLSILVARAGGQGAYANPGNVIEYAVIIAGMVLSGLATNSAQRLADLNAQAEIAGVSTIDTAVAGALTQTAHAVRLLGCVIYLCGIASEVAATLVQLRISFDGITPVRSPQEPLAHFTTRTSMAAVRSANRAN